MMKFWRKDPSKWLTRHDPRALNWFACTISTMHYLDLMPNMQSEVHVEGQVLRASWGLAKERARWDIWENDAHLASLDKVFEPKMLAPFFLHSHLCLEHALELLKDCARVHVSGVTTPELTSEGKALQWLQATLKVLSNALESCERDPEKLVQASLFLGKKDEKSLPLFRAVVFNLDITAGFDAEGALGVVVFDDKNNGAGTSRTPALEARFKALKPPVLDEFIRLTEAVMKATEARYI